MKDIAHQIVENIVEKGENAVYSIFSFSHNVFKGLCFLGAFKTGIVLQRVKVKIKATSSCLSYFFNL